MAPPRGWLLPVALSVCVLLGVLHRVLWLPWHTHGWALDALSYFEPQARALHALRPDRFLLAWQGLHPPVAGWIHGTLLALGVPLAGHWAVAIAASVLAAVVGALGIRKEAGDGAAVLFAAWLALAPLQGWYGAWIGPYPAWVLLLVASSCAMLNAMAAPSPRRLFLAGLLAGLTAWTHVLSLAAVGVQALVLWRRGPDGRRLLWGMGRRWTLTAAIAVGVVVAGALFRAGDPWTYHVGESDSGWILDHLRVLSTRFGPAAGKLPWAVVVAAGITLGLTRGARWAVALLFAQALALLAALGIFLELGVADARLTHYESGPQALLLLAAALGLGSAFPRGRARAFALGAAILGTGLSVPSQARWSISRLQDAKMAASAEAPRAVRALFDDALPGDSIVWLWAPGFLEDEPESLDGPSLGWPVSRLGAPCLLADSPPLFCHQAGGVRFWSTPNRVVDDEAGWADALERVFAAGAPGRTTVVTVGNEAGPARPWPMEALFRRAGLDGAEQGGIILWRPLGAPR